MKRIKATEEIKALKSIIRDQSNEINHLISRIDELEAQLDKSRAKEGKGCLETMIENLTDAFASLDFNKLIEMNPDLLEIEGQEDDNNAI